MWLSVSVCLCVYLSAAGTRRCTVTAPYHAVTAPYHDTPINKSCICRPSPITLSPPPAPASPTAQFLACLGGAQARVEEGS